MDHLKMSENIVYLRRKRGITQEALAEFLGVTKASVSKWETGLSLPDILLLPKLASYFDISIDELMGYQAQLSPEEIRKTYHKFSADFATEEFQKVMQETRDFVKQYYSCYPALLQIVLLWLNHHTLAEQADLREEILKEALELCRHIEGHCADMRICEDAVCYRAIICFVLGDSKEVIRILEPQHDPKRVSGHSEGILIQAYQAAGEPSKSEAFNQFMIYTHLLALVNDSITYLLCHMQDGETARETIRRIRELIRIYGLDELHPNTALQFYLQQAVFFCMQGEEEEALASLQKYAEVGEPFIKNNCLLHGDSYFNRIEDYFKDLDLGMQPPRNGQTIWDSFRQALEHPAFALLHEKEKFRRMKKKLSDTPDIK